MRYLQIILIVLLFLFSARFASADLEISDGSVVALYHMEDATDSSGNGFNLTNANGVTFQTGKLSNAASSTGSNGLDISNDLGIAGGIFSVSFWVNMNSQPALAEMFGLVSNGDATTNTSYNIGYQDSEGTKKMYFNMREIVIVDNNLTPNQTLNTGTWYHIVYTYDDATINGYVDNTNLGLLAAEGNGSSGGTDHFNVFRIRLDNEADFGHAEIDEVVVFDTVISTSTISDLYNGGDGVEVCNTAGCATGVTPRRRPGLIIGFLNFWSVILPPSLSYKDTGLS